jgi:hypothetical protein
MASIRRETTLHVNADAAWAALREPGLAQEAFAPVLSGCEIEGDVRTVRFAAGMVARERILDVDDAHRRIAYAALDVAGVQYHHASMQIESAGPGRCQFVWITDVVPEAAVAGIGPLVEAGTAAFKHNVEAGLVGQGAVARVAAATAGL